MRQVRKLMQHSGGATAVEFAFTAPLFLMLAFGLIDGGMALWTQSGLENAVEAASRCASVNTTTCSDATAVASYAANNTLGANIPASAFTLTKSSCGNQVAASYDYPFLSSYFHAAKVTLTAQSCFPDINAG